MTAPLRLGAFALILAAAFVAAAAVGRAVGPLEREVARAEEHGEQAALGIAPNRTTFPAGVPTPFAFRIVREDGTPLVDYDVAHERRMHLIVVSRDLTFFRHLHPSGPRGDWVTTLRLVRPGVYHAFADFTTDGERRTLGADLFVPGRLEARSLPAPSRTATAGPYRVTLHGDVGRGELEFEVTRGGRPVAVATYLGARGHLVVLRQGDLAYVHSHAELDELAFETSFPSAGRYRLFLQFRARGVRTAAFTVEVAR